MDAPWPFRLGWVRVAELGLGFLFIVAGMVKLAGLPFMVDLFALLGYGQWLRYVTALVELTGGVLLVTRRLEYLAALALAVIMVGATVASIVVFYRSPIPPAATFVLLVAIAWARHPSGEGISGR
jgi:DoxX-like protein